MANTDRKYIVPPDLGAAYLVCGMKIRELVLTVFLFFIALTGTLHGHPKIFLLPVTSALLFYRFEGSNTNILTQLKIRIGYFISVQQYSLNPWKGRS